MFKRVATVIVPWVLASTVGILVLVHFFIAMPGLDPLFNGLVEWATIIAGFAIILGMVNVAQAHGRRVLKRQSGWGYSVVLLLSALVVIVLGLLPGSTGLGDPPVQWIFSYVISPLSTTFFSLLAFFLVSAIVRALSLRNLEASVVTVVALIVLLGQVPIASSWSFLEPIVRLQEWLLRVPAMAGVRAILIGAAVGALATGARVLMGLDRPYVE